MPCKGTFIIANQEADSIGSLLGVAVTTDMLLSPYLPFYPFLSSPYLGKVGSLLGWSFPFPLFFPSIPLSLTISLSLPCNLLYFYSFYPLSSSISSFFFLQRSAPCPRHNKSRIKPTSPRSLTQIPILILSIAILTEAPYSQAVKSAFVTTAAMSTTEFVDDGHETVDTTVNTNTTTASKHHDMTEMESYAMPGSDFVETVLYR